MRYYISMSAEDIFVELARDYGGAYTGDDQSVAQMRCVVKQFVDASYNWPTTKHGSPEIYLGVVSTTKLNAFVTFESGYDIIAIHKGTSIIIPPVFNALLAVTEPFTDPPEISSAERPSWSKLPRDTAMILEEVPSPTDHIRRGLADYCIYCAYVFIALHELGHVRHGHMRLPSTKDEHNLPMIDERHQHSSDASSTLTAQTLEMDADTFAVWHSLPLLPLFRKAFSSNADIFGNDTRVLGWWIYAVYCLIKLFGLVFPRICVR